MGTSNVKRLQLIAFLGLATFVALGYTVVQRGFTEIARFGQRTFTPRGPKASETRSLGSFDRIDAGGIFDVDVSFGSTPSVLLEAPKDLLPHLTTRVSHGTLKLEANVGFNLNHGEKIRAHVVVRRLLGASISGAGKMNISGKITENTFEAMASGAATLQLSASVDRFKLDASGAAKTTINALGAHSLDVQASGAAECTIDGNVGSSKIDASGASHIKGNLTSDKAEVQTSGAAHAALRVVNSILASADGASSISYSGRPGQVSVHTSGVGNVRHN